MSNNYNPFVYSFPTRVYFNGNWRNHLISELSSLTINKLTLFYGSKHFLESGYLEELILLITNIGIEIQEIGDCNTNPNDEVIIDLSHQVLNFKSQLLLAVGGGSIIDTVKAISIYSTNTLKENFWSYLIENKPDKDIVIPIGVISTLPSSGSESNGSYVIFNSKLKKKIALSNLSLRPLFSIFNIDFVINLSLLQIRRCIADICSHFLEQFFVLEELSYTDFLLSESIVFLLKLSLSLDESPANDIVSKSNMLNDLMLTSSLALSYAFQAGRTTDWVAHEIEHSISGYMTSNHSEGMAYIIPIWIDFSKDNKNYKNRIQLLGQRLGISDIQETIRYIRSAFDVLITNDYRKNINKTFSDNKHLFLENFNYPIGRVSMLNKNEMILFIDFLLNGKIQL